MSSNENNEAAVAGIDAQNQRLLQYAKQGGEIPAYEFHYIPGVTQPRPISPEEQAMLDFQAQVEAHLSGMRTTWSSESWISQEPLQRPTTLLTRRRDELLRDIQAHVKYHNDLLHVPQYAELVAINQVIGFPNNTNQEAKS